MITAQTFRNPSPSTAAMVRFSAFVVAVVSAVIIPVALCFAASGHTSVHAAFAVTAMAALATLVTVLAARSLDPFRR